MRINDIISSTETTFSDVTITGNFDFIYSFDPTPVEFNNTELVFNNCTFERGVRLFAATNLKKLIFNRCIFKGSLERAFERNRDLETVEFNDCNTFAVTNALGLFEDCRRLKNLKIPICTRNMSDMAGMFEDCASLEHLDLSTFDTSYNINFNYMFKGCNKLEDINMNFDTSSGIHICNVFDECYSLKSVNVSNWTFMKVDKYATCLFRDCRSLKEIKITIDNRFIKDISQMFSGCEELVSVEIKLPVNSRINNMSSLFNRCSSLTDVSITAPTEIKLKDASKMFKRCEKLTSLALRKIKITNDTCTYRMFDRCHALEQIDMNITCDEDLFKDCESLLLVNDKPYHEKVRISLSILKPTIEIHNKPIYL